MSKSIKKTKHTMDKKLAGLALVILLLGFGLGRWGSSLTLGSTTASNVAVGGTLTVTGATTLNGGLTLSSGSLSLTSATLTVGSSGTALNRVNVGTCYLNLGNAPATFPATSTVSVDCQASNMLSTASIAQAALTGVNVNDIVMVEQATTTPTTFEGVRVLSANASSTQGYITVKLYNGTGADMTPGTTTVAGLQYLALDN